MAYSSLFKQDVRITQAYKGASHKGLDLSTGKVEQPVYLPSKAIEGYVWKVLSGYSYGGKYYANSPIIYIKHKNGSGSRYIHSYTKNVKVKVGDTIKVGDQICATGNSGYSLGDHLHFEWLKKWDDLNSHTDPAPLIFNENTMDFKKGDRIIFTGIQNFRGSPAGGDNGDSFVGMIGTVFDGPRTATYEGVSYTWWDIHADNGLFGWVAEVGKFKLFTDPVVPPVESECEKRVKILEAENTTLRESLATSQAKSTLLQDRVDKVESDLAVCNQMIKDLEGDVLRLTEELGRVTVDRNRFEEEKLELQRKLDELEQGRDSILKRLGDIIYKLFKRE